MFFADKKKKNTRNALINFFGISFHYFLEGGSICDKEKEKNNEMKELFNSRNSLHRKRKHISQKFTLSVREKILFSLHLYDLNSPLLLLFRSAHNFLLFVSWPFSDLQILTFLMLLSGRST